MNKNQNKKEWLSRYRELSNEVERETASAEYWKRKAYTLSAVNFENMGIRANRKTDNGEYVVKFLELRERCILLAERAQEQKEEILEAVESIGDSDCRDVLRMRYIDGRTFENIASALGYSIRWVFSKHRKGLNNIQISKSVQ